MADTAGVVEQVHTLGRTAGWVDVRPVGAVTVGLAGEQLAELGAMADSRAQVRVFSDDGICVHDPVLMRRALEYVKAFDGVVAQHAQEPRLTAGAQMNEGDVSAVLGLAGWPAVAEESIIARDVLLAQHVGSRLHVCHVSTAGSVEIIRWAKSRGINVTAEVTPHHLWLTDELVRSYDPVYKVNPPLRTDADVQALRAALADGTIDVVGTDHAPHPSEHKECEWAQAAMGMTGLETALSVVQHTMIETGLMGWADFARVTSTAPAAIGRLEDQGRPLDAGEPANVILVDPAARWTVDPSKMATMGRNSPFAGQGTPGQGGGDILQGPPHRPGRQTQHPVPVPADRRPRPRPAAAPDGQADLFRISLVAVIGVVRPAGGRLAEPPAAPGRRRPAPAVPAASAHAAEQSARTSPPPPPATGWTGSPSRSAASGPTLTHHPPRRSAVGPFRRGPSSSRPRSSPEYARTTAWPGNRRERRTPGGQLDTGHPRAGHRFPVPRADDKPGLLDAFQDLIPAAPQADADSGK